MKSETARLKKRIEELEAMVAMAQPPSLELWPVRVVYSWIGEQGKIKSKLDRKKKAMSAVNKAREVVK